MKDPHVGETNAFYRMSTNSHRSKVTVILRVWQDFLQRKAKYSILEYFTQKVF